MILEKIMLRLKNGFKPQKIDLTSTDYKNTLI